MRSIIVEKAVLAKDASASGLALYDVAGSDSDAEIIMYSPTIAINDVTEALAQLAIDEMFDMNTAIQTAIEKSIVGYARLATPDGPCNGAMEMTRSAAQKGYGPLLYDIAMSFSGKLVSDRRNVSSAAKSIWGKYYQKNSGVHGGVGKEPLDDIADPQTPDPEDDCEFVGDDENDPLNYSYYSQKSLNVNPMKTAHESFVATFAQMVKSQGIKKNNIEKRIRDAGEEFFGIKYMEGLM